MSRIKVHGPGLDSGRRGSEFSRRESDFGIRRGSTFSQRSRRSSKISQITEGSQDEFIECNEFDEILDLAGSEGKLQNQLLYGFIIPFIAIMPFFTINSIFMLYEPNHWCHVPGKDPEVDMEIWKNSTIPKEIGPDGIEQFSKCSMYVPYGEGSIIECAYGWDYDHTDYTQTIPSAFDWVCSKAHYGTAAFSAAAAGNCIGAPIFGWAGDKYGRKSTFFITFFMNIFFRGISLFIVRNFSWFLVTQFLVGTSFPMMYIAPFTILAEMCSIEYRSWVYASSWMVWVVGICILPIVAWLCGDWFIIGVVTTLPGVLMFAYYNMLPESPRWLVSAGRLNEAAVIIKNIAKVNGNSENFKKGELEGMLKDLYSHQITDVKRPQVWDLFRHRRVGKYTILLSIVWAMNGLVYYGITLNTTNMAGNQFVNFFILSAVELPVGMIGRKLVEKLGRRWPQVIFFAFCITAFWLAAIGVSNHNMSLLVIVAVIIAKFSVALTSLIVNLQSNEIFPTQLRSSGNGFVCTFAAIIGIAAPTIVYLRNFHPGAPYFVLGIICLLGMISSSFLPETLEQTLPETLDDTNKLGKNIKYFSFLPKDYKINENNKNTGNEPDVCVTTLTSNTNTNTNTI